MYLIIVEVRREKLGPSGPPSIYTCNWRQHWNHTTHRGLTWCQVVSTPFWGLTVQFKMVAMCLEMPICIPLHLRSLPNVAFEMIPMFVWLTTALSRPLKKDHLARPLHASLLQAIDGVMSLALCSSKLVILPNTSLLWWLLCPPVCLLGHLPSLRHVHGNTRTHWSFRKRILAIDTMKQQLTRNVQYLICFKKANC